MSKKTGWIKSTYEKLAEKQRASNKKFIEDMKKIKEESKIKPSDMREGLILNLGKRGERLLSDNIHNDEKILVQIKGSFGEALVLTNKRLYILKWGYMSGNLIGGRCIAFDYGNITALELKRNLLTGTFEVLSPSTQNAQKSYWGSGSDNAIKSDNVVTFQRSDFHNFSEAVKIGRELISKPKASSGTNYDDLEKLAKLKEKGILTEEEYSTKKKAILGL